MSKRPKMWAAGIRPDGVMVVMCCGGSFEVAPGARIADCPQCRYMQRVDALASEYHAALAAEEAATQSRITPGASIAAGMDADQSII